mmetsp:Transcript_64175/g.162642  ORF Transcript_64175/g.162642 Transcript_64175/m.162642 type:complete len:99 (+) Transcript_64175:314-610(+)
MMLRVMSPASSSLSSSARTVSGCGGALLMEPEAWHAKSTAVATPAAPAKSTAGDRRLDCEVFHSCDSSSDEVITSIGGAIVDGAWELADSQNTLLEPT